MATVKFIIKGNSALSQIYVRVRDGRNVDISTKTQLIIDASNWSSKKGEVKQTSAFQEKQNLQKKLNGLENSLLDQIQKAKINGIEIEKEWLNQCIEKFHGKIKDDSTELIKVIENLIITRKNGLNKLERQTTKSFGTTILHVKKYQEFKKKKFHLFEVDNNFLESLIIYLKETERYASSTINKDISRIIQVCKAAKLKGLEVNDSIFLAKYTSAKPQRRFVTLSIDELSTIGNFQGPDFLENVRDWLIIGFWTGCRIGDLLNLNKNNIIKKTDGSTIIRYTQTKTQKTVDLTIHKQVFQIINRLKGFPRPISDVKFNKYIKELCKRCGIDQEEIGEKINPLTKRKEEGLFPKYELITSHICRRSFATYHYGKIPTVLIMMVTGHATERQFLEYIGEIDSKHHINEFDNFYKSNEN